MTKKKYKLKKKRSLLLLLVIILITIFFFLNYDKTKKQLEKIGYNKEQIDIIYEILDEEKTILLEHNYIKEIEKILINKEFKIENINLYLEIYNKINNIDNTFYLVNNKEYIKDNKDKYLEIYQEDRNIDDIIYIINNNITYEYSDKLISLIHEKYFKLSNLDRYMNYDKIDAKTIVSEVNSNLDYEYYTNIKPSDITKEHLLIVNKYYNLEKNYSYGELVTMSSEYSVNSNQKLSSIAYEAFKELVKAGEQDGVHVRNLSAYRSYDTQNNLYLSYKKNGQAYADKWSARPGHSEHQTGLALDVCARDSYTYKKFGTTNEFKWMKENSYKYGFILRYPENKQHITGYGYEPWHYRYVGKEVATYIYENDITYEEYYEFFIK